MHPRLTSRNASSMTVGGLERRAHVRALRPAAGVGQGLWHNVICSCLPYGDCRVPS